MCYRLPALQSALRGPRLCFSVQFAADENSLLKRHYRSRMYYLFFILKISARSKSVVAHCSSASLSNCFSCSARRRSSNSILFSPFAWRNLSCSISCFSSDSISPNAAVPLSFFRFWTNSESDCYWLLFAERLVAILRISLSGFFNSYSFLCFASFLFSATGFCVHIVNNNIENCFHLSPYSSAITLEAKLALFADRLFLTYSSQFRLWCTLL